MAAQDILVGNSELALQTKVLEQAAAHASDVESEARLRHNKSAHTVR